ncbi:MAG: lipase class 2 [Acidimicrobiales bacterium]|nr:lipase class 2 [Acidimicrobiales bacterium]
MRARRRLTSLLAIATVAATAAVAPGGAARAADRDPVVIVAGTLSPQIANEPLAARLRGSGYDASIFVLPTLGLQDIDASARALGAYVDTVLARTGATKVDLVGHSQGGLVARSFVKDFGGASKVDSLITLGTPNTGTYVANLVRFLGFGNCLAVVACTQMSIGSAYLRALNQGDTTVGNVRYTAIRTFEDELVRPVDNARIGDGAVNVLVQSKCWLRVVGHVGLIVDGAVYSGIRQALEGRTNISLNCFAL